MRRASIRLAVVIGVVLGLQALGPIVQAVSLPACTTDSTPTGPTFIVSGPCGTYGVVPTRQQAATGATLDVVVDYMVHAPAGPAKALLILFTGGQGNAGIAVESGQLVAGRNFLVRSAQLFAESGFLVVTIDRPEPLPMVPYDQYRISPAHAQDIVAVMNATNSGGLSVFLVGTSRGTLSTTAQHALGAGSMLSSPVTSSPGVALYIGAPGYPLLAPESVAVPVHVMAHRLDACLVSTPADAELLHERFRKAGVDSRLDRVQGGFDLAGQEVDGIEVDPCDALTHHGFLGMESAAVREIVKRTDQLLNQLGRFPGNRRPVAGAGSLQTAPGSPVQVDLAALATDPDGNILQYFIPHEATARGGTLSLAGTVVVYSPPAGTDFTDGFVYGVKDGRGGVAVAVVTVGVGLP
jgi:hypothetical protein